MHFEVVDQTVSLTRALQETSDVQPSDLMALDSIAKHAKSKNRMQITEFPARLSRHKLVLREIQGI